ncbi:gliding motility lipoprotein GldB [Robertkochia aurantiaca]|uniref:gliding motility lipoprotein GldB n=1 Tax=Robertkochia aurantiaca TaxID=2873700 RepID=UPI001CCCF8F7|nr:gliding motility lipoprotein GldB [Robertkochia sp. 3YJGBD-33]
MSYLKRIFCCGIVLLVFSCAGESKREQEIDKIQVEMELMRFDREFAQAGPEDLSRLKSDFPYLFPDEFEDSVWYQRMTDTIQQELFAEVGDRFPDHSDLEQELYELMQHYKYYFPDTSIPDVVTVTSDVDYRNRVIYADSLVLIGLDNYLGPEHHFYAGIPVYVKEALESEQISVDVAMAMGRSKVPGYNDRAFVAQMVYYGKLYYLISRLLPEKSEAAVMGYTEDDYAWADANEAEIWRYFVERDLLFSTDRKLQERFIDPAPFSKFYLELDNESPGRLGRYLGWKIVQAYMENNEVSLQQMLQTPAEVIFNEAKYKPEK